MSLSPVFLLPLVALAMAVFLPLFGKRARLSSSRRSRRRRRILLGRFAIVALLLATVVTILLPIAGLNPLVQGVLVTAAIMVPVWIVLGLMGWKAGKSSAQLVDEPAHSIDDFAYATETRQETRGPAYLHELDAELSRPRPIDLSVPTLENNTRRANGQTRGNSRYSGSSQNREPASCNSNKQ